MPTQLMAAERIVGVEQLLRKPIHPVSERQLSLFTRENIQVGETIPFNPQEIRQRLLDNDGRRGIFVDIGGSTIRVAEGKAQDGRAVLEGASKTLPLAEGRGHYSILEDISRRAQSESLPVGISIATGIRGTRLRQPANIPYLYQDLEQFSGGDFKNLFENVVFTLRNDAEAGTMASAIKALEGNPRLENLLYLINGTGFGAAVLKSGHINGTEIGHRPILPELNPYNQEQICGQYGNNEACIEKAVAGPAIELAWRKLTGSAAGGEEINNKYQLGDKNALDLYDLSAHGVAHAVVGLNRIFDLRISENLGSTTFVFHGGVEKVPGYMDRVVQITKEYLKIPQSMKIERFSTSTLPDDAGLLGAATAALAA